jgi:hypothetical protein
MTFTPLNRADFENRSMDGLGKSCATDKTTKTADSDWAWRRKGELNLIN